MRRITGRKVPMAITMQAALFDQVTQFRMQFGKRHGQKPELLCQTLTYGKKNPESESLKSFDSPEDFMKYMHQKRGGEEDG